MKKLANILLVTMYAISCIGIGIKQFYCCGKLKSTSISYVQQQCVNEKCGIGKCKSGCCKDDYRFFKLSEDHIASSYLFAPEKQISEWNNIYPAEQVLAARFQQIPVAHKSHAPPLRHGIPAFVLNCVYRIWFLPSFPGVTCNCNLPVRIISVFY